MPSMEPTHLLLLYYATSQRLGWHRDDGAQAREAHAGRERTRRRKNVKTTDGGSGGSTARCYRAPECISVVVLLAPATQLKTHARVLIQCVRGLFCSLQDGASRQPVVSLSLGDACDFCLKVCAPRKARGVNRRYA
jgi:hypothetical protein